MDKTYQVFTSLILNISRCVQKIKNAEVAGIGMKGKHVQCLYFLQQDSNGLSLKQLCHLCDEDKGAMSRTVKELMAMNLVYVAEQSTQKYRNPIRLTEEGKANADIVMEKIGQMVTTGGIGLTDPEREVFYKVLTQISNNLTKVCKTYGEKDD